MVHRLPSLRRKAPSRLPTKKFFVYREGKNTEPSYLQIFRPGRYDAEVVIVVEPAAGTPFTIARKAVERALALRRSRDCNCKDDEVWVLFDRDSHPKWANAINLCRSNGIGLAYSDPCFELWLILHFRDYDADEDRHALQRTATAIVPGYDANDRKVADCSALFHLVEQAEQRAQLQCRRRSEEGNAGGSPSTLVWKLTTAIREWKRQIAKTSNV